MKFKKAIATVLAAALAASCVACSSSSGDSSAASSSMDAEKTSTSTNYPEKIVSIIVPFGAGGGADIAVRVISKYAEKELGQKIVINNVSGGSGTVGLTQLSKAKPDGYTLGYFASTNSNDNLLFKGISYTADSFEPIIQFSADPHIIVASKKSGITDMNGLIAKAKEKPNELTYGLGGAWTSWDFLRLSLEEKTGVKFKRMVFQGGAAAINALASGDCDVAVPFVSEALAQIQAGNVVPIAITSAKRFELVPDVKTIKESGLDFDFTMWRGIVAPAGVPQDVVDKVSDAFKKAYDNADYQKEALNAGIFSEFKDAQDFKTFYKENHEKYKKMIEGANISTQ